MIAVTAEWAIQLWVHCPECQARFDFINTEEYQIMDHDVLTPATNQSALEINSVCTRCKHNFNIKKTVY